MRLRSAVRDDLDRLAAVFLSCWRISYVDVLPPATLVAYDETSSRRLWSAYLVPVADPDLVVAVEKDEVLGLAVVRADEGYLASLYVDPSAQGAGVGRVLFAEASRRCAAAGCWSMRWWVFAANVSGVAFYSRMGGAATGRTRTESIYGAPEIELSTPL